MRCSADYSHFLVRHHPSSVESITNAMARMKSSEAAVSAPLYACPHEQRCKYAGPRGECTLLSVNRSGYCKRHLCTQPGCSYSKSSQQTVCGQSDCGGEDIYQEPLPRKVAAAAEAKHKVRLPNLSASNT